MSGATTLHPQATELRAQDGHGLGAYVASPAGTARAGIVVVQEIFGVNAYIRSVADRFAEQGYLAIAPALFDRYERGYESGYSATEVERSRAVMARVDIGAAMLDVLAAVEFAREECEAGVGVVGFCLGGTLAWLAAGRLPVSAAVGYYGGYIAKNLQVQPQVPALLHFGAEDAHIPTENVEAIRSAFPDLPVFVYEQAGHGFACDQRASYAPAAAAAAWERTLRFLDEQLRPAGEQPAGTSAG